MSDAAGILETRHGRVLELVIRNPAQRNALNPEISRALTRALQLAGEDASVGAVVLRGDGAHCCAGGNLKTLADLQGTAGYGGKLVAQPGHEKGPGSF